MIRTARLLAALALPVALLVVPACSAADERSDVPAVQDGPSPFLETSVRQFSTARSLADLPEGGSRTPASAYLSPRCAAAGDDLAPVFELAVIRGYDESITGDAATASYDITTLEGAEVSSTPDSALAPPGPLPATMASYWEWTGWSMAHSAGSRSREYRLILSFRRLGSQKRSSSQSGGGAGGGWL